MTGSYGAVPAWGHGTGAARRACQQGLPWATGRLLVVILCWLLAAPALGQPADMTACDVLAADPDDSGRVAEAVPRDALDAARAVPACEEAVSRWPGHPRLLFQLGRAYDRAGRQAEGIARYHDAMAAGYGAAASALAREMGEGGGQAGDAAAVVRLHQWAANRGHVGSMIHLALLYETGRGVANDDTLAVAWYNRAFEASGSPEAAISLARLLVEGRGVPRDDGRAVGLLRAAAQRDDAEAAFSLVRLAEQGHAPGVPWMEQVRLLTIAERSPAYRDAVQPSLDRLAVQGGADAIAASRRAAAMRAATREQGEAAARQRRDAVFVRWTMTQDAAVRRLGGHPGSQGGPGRASGQAATAERDLWDDLLAFTRQWVVLYLGIVAVGYVVACARILRRRKQRRLAAESRGEHQDLSRGFGSFLAGVRESVTNGEAAVVFLMAVAFSGLGFATYYALTKDSVGGDHALGLSLAASLVAPIVVFIALTMQTVVGRTKAQG